MWAVVSLLLSAAAPVFAAQFELPMFFFENTGQAESSVRYIAQTPELRAAFRPDSITFQTRGMHVQVRFTGANPRVKIAGAEPMPGTANFFLGQDWKTSLPIFNKIVYQDLYPGIDMTYGGAGRRIKSEFIVAPGANPDRIRMNFNAADQVYVDADGALVVSRSGVELREEAPEIYQDGGRVRVEGSYRLLDAHTVGFEIGSYDTSRTLIVDPVVSYCTYLGGSSTSTVTGLAVDGSGNLYVTGWTEALDFPIAGAMQAANQGGVDVFVVKLNAAGTAIVYATYIGGRGDDRAAGIAVDSAGQAYVTGSTASANFPVAAAIRVTLGGSRNAFALKLNAVGNSLVYSTYLGGSTYDVGTAIAVDGSGNAYIAGDTQSPSFPVSNAAQGTFGGKTDAFVAKLTSSGAIAFSTFLGGAAAEHAGGIAIDSSGNVYVAGGTYSTNFPVAGAIQGANAGGQDVFVTKIASSGSTFLYSTYLGGNGGTAAGPEQANAIAVDASGNAYVTGVTTSGNFPVTSGAFQKSLGGSQDAFISKINPAGNALVYGTYLGGTSFDWAAGIAVGGGGNAYIAGYTSSLGFPTAGAVQAAFNGFYDAFVSELNAAGNGLVFSTCYGGSGSDGANAIALDANGNIFAGGQTNSLNLPLQAPIEAANSGGGTGWVLRLGVTAPPPQAPAAISVTPSSGSGNTVIFTALYSHPAGATSLATASLLLNAGASTDFACYVSYSPAVNQFKLANDLTSSSSATVIPGGGNAQNSQCTLRGAGSSASLSGTTLTLTVSLAFQPGFPGNKGVYLYAADLTANTGWVALGTWTATIAPPQPSADSVSPNSGAGASQTFTFVFSDTQNAANVATMGMLIAPSFAFPNSCYFVYDVRPGTIQLARDDALGSTAKPVGSTTVLQNSQCAVGATSATISGLSVIVTAAITFKGVFTGPKNIYMFAVEGSGANTGWVQKGTFSVAAGGVPVANSVVPAAGAGPSQRFSFTVSDQGGSSFITDVAVVIGPSLSFANSCVLVYDRLVGVVSLAYDNPANGAGRLVPGSNTVISNSQCILRGASTTVVFGATSVELTLDLVFNAAYLGAKSVFLYAAELNANSGWASVGSWTVTGGAPTADSVSPASGAGAANSSSFFTLTVSDSVTSANLTGLSLLFTGGAPNNTTNACYVVYTLPFTIALYSDNALSFNTKGLGTSTTLQNSQCAIGFTAAALTSNSLILTIEIVFKPAFRATQSVYLQASEPNTSSGWVSRGTWTVQ